MCCTQRSQCNNWAAFVSLLISSELKSCLSKLLDLWAPLLDSGLMKEDKTFRSRLALIMRPISFVTEPHIHLQRCFCSSCTSCCTASYRNYLLHHVLTARSKIHTPFNQYSHYPNWRLPAKNLQSALHQKGNASQQLQMAVARLSHRRGQLGLIETEWIISPSLSAFMDGKHTHTHITYENTNTVRKTNGRLLQGHLCLKSRQWQRGYFIKQRLNMFADLTPSMWIGGIFTLDVCLHLESSNIWRGEYFFMKRWAKK